MGVDFSRVIDALPGLVWTALADGFIDFVNQRWCEYTGLSLENAYGWGWQTAICPEDLPGLLERWRSILASGVPGEFEARLRRFDGEYRRFLVCTSALRDATGQIVKWCGVSTDVEDRRRAEEALRARERFRVIVDDLPAMVTLMTPDGEFAEGNRHMREYFGAPLEELKRRPTTYSFHPDDRPSVDAQWKESVETGRPYDFEARLRRADGTYRWFHTRGFPLRDAEGRIVLWHLLQTDVDDRKRAEDALRASERNLKLIIDTIPALAWSARPDGSARFFSQHYLDFMGLSAEQASDWGWTVAVHPDDMNGLAATWQRIMASEALGEAEARLHRRDGEYRWFLFRANPLRDESGAIVKWYGVNTDIEDRKQAEDALRRSETFLLEVQRLSHTGGWRYDVATGTVESSPEILRGYAVQPGEDVSKPPFRFDRIHPDDRARVQAQFERSVREKTEYRAAYRIVLPDGSIRYQHVTGHPVINDAGELVEFIGAAMEMTEHWRATNELERASEALRELQMKMSRAAQVATIGELAASIAHEVNQPLSGIITNASTCLRMLDANPPDVDGARETARRTIRDGNRASDVITRLRALFIKKEFTLEPVDLNEATREVIAVSLSELQRNQVIVQSELADDLPSITGDRVQLQQVILNLLRNASDAMVGVDDRPRQLLIRTEREGGDCVRVAVRHAGVGIERQGMRDAADVMRDS